MKFKNIISLLLSIALLLCLCSCKKGSFESVKEVTPYGDVDALGDFFEENGTVCENDRFSLYWDKENVNIILRDKNSGEYWSTTPIDQSSGLPVSDENNIYSPIDIEYIFRSAFKTADVTGKLGAVNNGRVTSKKIENGIEVTFLFSEVQISVPIQFVLKENGLEVSVDLEKIGENSDATGYRIFNISLAPYLCSVKNSSNNYLVVPSGSGALMYTDERGEGAVRSYSGRVYGEDITKDKLESAAETEAIRMSVFGASKDGNNISCIINEGAELSTVYANAGSADTGYSNIYAEFNVRGSNTSTIDYGGTTGKNQSEYFSAQRISNGKISVTYTPSSSGKSAYTDMANEYRSYLKNSYGLPESCNDNQLSLDFYGGIETKKHIFGLPYNSLTVLTDYDAVERIVSDITENSGLKNLTVRLSGFGASGIDTGKLAGGFKLSQKFGDFSKIKNYFEKSGIELFADFDLLLYSKSGGGYSKNGDAARTANGYPAQYCKYSPETGAIRDDVKYSSIVARGKLKETADKLADKVDKYGIGGLSLSTLSNTSYSDYTDQGYVNCNLIQKDVTAILSDLKAKSFKTASDNANDYAACVSDKIFSAPIKSAGSRAFDLNIPLYGMVFKGYVPLSGESINISENSDYAFLKTLEFGGALQFSVIDNYSSEYASYLENNLQYMKYGNIKDSLLSCISNASDVLKKVGNAHITDYIVFEKTVRKTLFDNGVSVYVNSGESAASYDGVQLEPMSFKVVG